MGCYGPTRSARWAVFCSVVLLAVGCASAVKRAGSAWEQTEKSCQGKMDYCLDQCSKGIEQACQVLAVYQVEKHPESVILCLKEREW